MIVRQTIFKNYQKKIKDLETFKSIKEEIVYKINQVLNEKEEKEKQREIFKSELIERIESYLLDLPIGKYKLDYADVFSGKSKYHIIHIVIGDNLFRSFTEEVFGLNKKAIKISRDANGSYDEMDGWTINDILKFHNSLEKILILIGEQYGYKPTPVLPDQECEPCKS